MPEPISDEKREAIIRLAEAGDVPRNEIARQVGVGLATVSRVAHQVGLSFSRRATSAATKARQADLLAARLATAEGLLDDVGEARERLQAADNPRDYALLARATRDLADAHARLVAVDRDKADDLTDELSMLAKLGAAFELYAAGSKPGADEGHEQATTRKAIEQ